MRWHSSRTSSAATWSAPSAFSRRVHLGAQFRLGPVDPVLDSGDIQPDPTQTGQVAGPVHRRGHALLHPLYNRTPTTLHVSHLLL